MNRAWKAGAELEDLAKTIRFYSDPGEFDSSIESVICNRFPKLIKKLKELVVVLEEEFEKAKNKIEGSEERIYVCNFVHCQWEGKESEIQYMQMGDYSYAEVCPCCNGFVNLKKEV